MTSVKPQIINLTSAGFNKSLQTYANYKAVPLTFIVFIHYFLIICLHVYYFSLADLSRPHLTHSVREVWRLQDDDHNAVGSPTTTTTITTTPASSHVSQLSVTFHVPQEFLCWLCLVPVLSWSSPPPAPPDRKRMDG